jgi:hypothetical protein
MTLYKVLGKLLDDAVLRIIKELEDLTDISEKESHKLAALCGLLFECEDQFDSAGPLVERIKGNAYNDEVWSCHYVCFSDSPTTCHLTDCCSLFYRTRFITSYLHGKSSSS